MDFKTRQGVEVGVESVQWIVGAYPGSNMLEKIRALEQDRLADYGSRFQYVMLVGPHSVIPFAHFSLWFSGKNGDGQRDLDACFGPSADPNMNALGVERRYTDWPYADLVSDFDGYLLLVDPGGQIIAENDDYGSISASRIQAELTQSGPHRIVVTTYATGAEGDYTLALSSAASPSTDPNL